MIRKPYLLLLLLIVFIACGKNADTASVTTILESHNWNLYNIHRIIYESTAAGKIILSDTIINSSDCDKNTNYQFLANGMFKTNSNCINKGDSTGRWTLSENSILMAYIPQTAVQSSPYFIGISGKITEIDASHFITSSYINYNYSNSTVHVDSAITFSTYKR